MQKFDDITIRKVWEIEMEIMDEIHRICEENSIRYSLAFGTLIGVVRHGGFIPWDDDIDIVMPRDDYNRFIEVWQANPPAGYLLQNKETNPDFTQSFSKVRKDHTTFLEKEEERHKSFHKGIFVDVSPCDRVPSSKLLRKVHYAVCAVQLLYSREHTSGNNGIIGAIEKTLLALPRKLRPRIRKMAEKFMCSFGDNPSNEWICPDRIENCKRYFSAKLFDELNLVKFQDRDYYAFANPDWFLNVRYGDYMQLPPEEERTWKHHPVCIDFSRNCEEIEEYTS